MPELPEVETTLRGIEPYARNAVISDTIVRNSSLRWPVPVASLGKLVGQRVRKIERRAKYILIHTEAGTILLHLGMSGSLSVLPVGTKAGKHDHIDLCFAGEHVVRLTDPRRFGCCLVLQDPVYDHKLLVDLGPEPLSEAFDGGVLFKRSRRRSQAIKNLIMDGRVVVGIGNIYASEALFEAGIRPALAAGRLSRKRCEGLAAAIKKILGNAIEAGGTTLNDFTRADGRPGYFSQELQVYGRADEPCRQCQSTIKSQIIGQRNTFYCTACQSF